jgi:hypothetical protein
MKYNILPLLVFFLLLACDRKPSVNDNDYIMELSYAPLWGQTLICLPDEVQKTIVDDKGALYYDYSCELSKGFRGYPHNDIIIVTLRNSSGKDTSVSPEFFIRSVYPVLFNRENKSLTIDKRITVSLPAGIESVTENSPGKNNYYPIKFSPITIKAGTINRMAVAGDGPKADISVNPDSSGHHSPSSVVIHLDPLNGTGKILNLKPAFPINEVINL